MLAVVVVALLCAAPLSAQTTISVTNVEELYRAVNDTGNTGAIIDVAPGTYVLTPTDPAGAPRPNRGALVLPAGATLRGHNEYVDWDGDGVWDSRDPMHPDQYADPATETVIDAFLLTSLVGSANVITLGLANGVERLTARSNTFAGSLIGVTQAPASGGLDGFVRDCVVEKGVRGLRAQHRDASYTGLASTALFERNITQNNLVSFGFGIQVQNAADDSSWTVVLRNNRSIGNVFGLIVAALGVVNTSQSVLSQNNIYERNSAGMVLHSGRDNGAAGSVGNGLDFHSVSDAIWNNNKPSPFPAAGGVDIRGGFRAAAVASPSSDNQLQAQFIGTRFVEGSGSENRAGGARRDMSAWGAVDAGGILPGSGNVVTLLITQSLSDGSPHSFLLVDSAPAGDNNRINVSGSDVAIARTNSGIVLEHNP